MAKQERSVTLTDHIIPLGDFDDSLGNRHAGLCACLFLFDELLDPIKLRNALEKLIKRPEWQKLGSRIRNNVHGRLNLHIPSTFTPERPAIRFSLAKHNCTRAKHPATSQLGDKDNSHLLPVEQDNLKSLLYGNDTPITLKDFLQTDAACLGLHIVQFTDSTIVTIQWPHVLFDMMALADVLHGWTLMLKGLGDTIQTPYAFDFDALASLGSSCTEPHSLANHQLSIPSLLSFGVRSGVQFIRSKTQHRMVYVPAWFLQSLRERALQGLRSTPEGSQPFLSDGDVLCAWWARLSVLHLDKHRHHDKCVALSNTMSMRPTLRPDILPPGQPFIANSTAIITALMTAQDVFEQSLGSIASKVRHSVDDLRRIEQVHAFAALQKGSWKRTPPVFGHHKMHGIMMSNWSKAKLFDVDFSGALVDDPEADHAERHNQCKPVFIQSRFAGGDGVEIVLVVGKDADGGYWLDCSTNENRWPAIEKAMARELEACGNGTMVTCQDIGL